jgi:hypothetical protein
LKKNLGPDFGAERKKPGFPGLRYRDGPACGVAATHPSNPSRRRVARTQTIAIGNCLRGMVPKLKA